MKRGAVSFARVFVGVLFIISGLVKANDPLGLGYKMQEFFEVWTASLSASSFLHPFFGTLNNHALELSLFIITIEIMAGVALLIGWKPRAVTGLLLVLIIFFTFLTGYAYGSGKFKNCGCFGDCIPISPLASLIKDIVLLVLILFLFWNHKLIEPVYRRRKQAFVLVMSLLLTIAIQGYALYFLPPVDCLPFKKGNNIAVQMKPPPNAVSDSFAINFIYERGGKRFEFAPENLPGDLASYTFVERSQKLLRQGNAEPAIKGFSLTSLSGQDYTTSILEEPKAVLVFVLNFENAQDWFADVQSVYKEARQKNIPFFVVSSEAAKGKISLANLLNEEVVFLNLDNVALKTAARANPTIYLIEKGTVIEKQSAAKAAYINALL